MSKACRVCVSKAWSVCVEGLECVCGYQSLVGCVGVKGLWCVLVSKACSVGVWVSKACRVCVGVEGL